MENRNITVINKFEVPQSSENDFLKFFKTHIKLIASQYGNMECRLFKNNDDKNIVNYTSIVCWKDEETMKKAGININQVSQKEGIDVISFQKEHNIKVINRIYSELPIL